MTKKEQGQMARLVVENRRLKEALDKHFAVYRETMIELVELKTKLEMIEFALGREDD